MSRPAINADRLLARLDAFAQIGATPAGGVNRQAFSMEDRQARALLAEIGAERGFAVEQDAMANLFLRRKGDDDSLPPVLIGSHLDSQPTGGRFDGALGTLAALEVLEAMEDAAFATRRPIELVAWSNEEGSRFAPGTMGSLAWRRGAVPAEWRDVRGADGAPLMQEIAATLQALPGAGNRPVGSLVSSFLELHIEQGPLLEKAGVPIGIVGSAQGTRWLNVRIQGQSAHAGTTPLAFRRDPLVAATEALHRLYAEVMPHDANARLTIGRFDVLPGSVNAIPSEVSLTVDIRHPDAANLDLLEKQAREILANAARQARCSVKVDLAFDLHPIRFSVDIVRIIESAAEALGLGYLPITSGAFHDAVNVAALAPSAMIFVPCRDGLSHNEGEFVEPGHAVQGAAVLLEATMRAGS